MLQIISLVLAGVLALGSLGGSDGTFNPKKLLAATEKIYIQVAQDAYRPICSTAAIGKEDSHYWLTAAHCYEEEGMYVMGDAATISYIDEEYDILILHTTTAHKPGLKLAKNAPTYGTPIALIGYPGPMKMHGPVVTVGIISNPNVKAFEGEEGWDRPYAILQLPSAPGNSGSPVVNYNSEVVSILQWGWGRTWSPMAGGVIFEKLNELRKYWQ